MNNITVKTCLSIDRRLLQKNAKSMCEDDREERRNLLRFLVRVEDIVRFDYKRLVADMPLSVLA